MTARFLALAAVALSFASGCGSERASQPRHNVLLITMDTTRVDRLGSYGYPGGTTPTLDALAADGVRFERAFATSGITAPAHASILTGLNPDRHGCRVFFGPTGHFLPESRPTLATVLRSNGWETAAFVSAYPASERFGLHWGFDTFETGVEEELLSGDPILRLPQDGRWLRQPVGTAQRRADATAASALAWLETASDPFLLWVHFFDPHDPVLVPPTEVTERFGVGPDDPDPAHAAYDSEIFFMDQQIGRLLQEVEARRGSDDTVVVVLSDHGQGLGQHGWFAHRLLYQEQIRIPMIVRVPGIPGGRVVSELARSIDVMPTVIDALGLEPPSGVQGRSLLGLMQGRAEPPRIAYAEALNTLDALASPNLPPRQKDLLFAIVDGDWKLIYHRDNPENAELYDLASDPGELANRAADRPEIVTRLVGVLEASGAMEIPLEEPEEPMPAEALERLRALGYVGN